MYDFVQFSFLLKKTVIAKFRQAQYGKLSILKYLCKKGLKCTNKTCSAAAGGGHLKILKWLYDSFGLVGNVTACNNAVENSNLDILKWLRDKNCPWSYNTCIIRIDVNNIEILDWITNNEYVWNNKVRDFLLNCLHNEIIEWRRNKNISGLNLYKKILMINHTFSI